MVEFSHSFPRKVVFGPNSVSQLPSEVSRLTSKNSKVLIVTDKTIAQLGIAGKTARTLEENEHHVKVFNDITGEPTLATAEAISEVVRAGKFDVVVGMGGGSCMDMAKIASVAATNPRPIREYIAFLEDRVENKTLPKILVPTTSGTGSEATSYAVVIEKTSKNFVTSSSVVADVSILDPMLTTSCPPKQTAGSGLDALSQCIEPYLSKASDIFSESFSTRGAQLISANLKQAYEHGDDMGARSAMALGAFYGGVAITTAAGVILGHCISETIGPRFRIPHGLACGIALPYIVKFNTPTATKRVASLLPYLSEEGVTGTRAKAKHVLQVIRKLVQELDVSLALKDYGISKDDARKTAKFIANEQQKNYALAELNPTPVNESNMTSMFEDMWQGNI